jgi:sulfate permease, SulP family
MKWILQVLHFKNDILSGLTVALALVPEAIAFSFILGVSPIVGLHAAFMMGLITALIGGRPGMISGATGAIAVIYGALVITHGIEYLFVAVLLMGLLQMLAGFLKLGKFARMIPHPVMLGFVNGLAIVIFLAQLDMFKVNGQWLPTGALGIMLLLVLLTMAIIHFLPKWTKAVPSTLVAIIVTSVIAYIMNNNGVHLQTVADFAKGGIAGGLPQFHIPNVPYSWQTLTIIFPYALTGALVGLIESLLTLTLVDELTNTRGRSNKECIAQGGANLVNGFFGGMGGCAMVGQSMINIKSGGRTRVSGVVAAVGLLFFVLFAAPVINMVPLAALVGVMFMVVINTFEWESLFLGKKVPLPDIIVIAAVTGITVWQDLAIAVVIGVILSALMFAWEKGKQISAEWQVQQGVKTYSIDGVLFFASVARFKDLFEYKEDPNEIIIDFKKSKVMDHSAIEAINFMTAKYKEFGKTLHLKHLSKDCRLLIDNADKIIDVNIMEDPHYFIADDSLA